MGDGAIGASSGLVTDVEALRARQAGVGRPYLEFLRVDALSAGLYVLAPQAVDRQQPHAQDEIYVVVGGEARFEMAGEVREVGAGSVVYVPAGVPHRFVDIRSELRTVVMFAPPESTP